MLSECFPTLQRGRALIASCMAAAGLAGCAADAPERVTDRGCGARPPVVYAALDVSDSGRSPALVAERMAAVEEVLTDAAVCGGRAKVVAFTASAAATDVLLDQELAPEGATRRAQLRRVPKLVDGALAEVRTKLPAAADHLPAGGTDVLAQLGLAAEFLDQAGPDRPLTVVIWSDGIATSPVDLNQADLDATRAGALALGVDAPDLAGALVTFAGVGRPAGAVPPTPFVDALKAFYRAACQRSGATCTVVSGASAARSI